MAGAVPGDPRPRREDAECGYAVICHRQVLGRLCRHGPSASDREQLVDIDTACLEEDASVDDQQHSVGSCRLTARLHDGGGPPRSVWAFRAAGVEVIVVALDVATSRWIRRWDKEPSARLKHRVEVPPATP